ncbi:MAG: hypothetical protein ACRD68_12240, partial [Pyrinomonadaceae bacterium]
MTFIYDLSPILYSPDAHPKTNVLSVGWLGRYKRPGWVSRLLPRNRPPRDGESLIATLRDLAALNQVTCRTFGYHTCETCWRENSRGEFWFESLGGIRYVLPNMLFHYIEAHGYVLPREVFDALRELRPVLAAKAEERRLREELREARRSHLYRNPYCGTCGTHFLGKGEDRCLYC